MYQQYQPGWLEVITGPMFAGKSEELIRRIRTLSYAKKSIVCFKPAIDDRYAKEEIASHAGNMWEAKAVKDVSEIKEFLKDKKYDLIENEIKILKAACGDKILKVIIETCFLTDEEKIKMCEIVTASGADYIKTSTGFGGGGATREDVALMAAHMTNGKKIKAAGGIANLQDAEDFLKLGADRLGTSRIVKAVKAMEKGE